MQIDLGDTLHRLGSQLHGPVNSYTITFDGLRGQLRELLIDLDRDLIRMRFAAIVARKADDHQKAKAKWEPICKVFPESKRDAEDATDSYAVGLDTAAIFHLMRVAEYGLRALARKMKVKLPKKKKLEWAQWNDILAEMDKKIGLIANTKAGRARDEKLEFYRGALGEFYGFKDAYRNHVMHTRGDYDEFQAASALNHVQDFMGRLSRKINNARTGIK